MKWWSDPTATFDMLVLVERQFQALDVDWLVGWCHGGGKTRYYLYFTE